MIQRPLLYPAGSKVGYDDGPSCFAQPNLYTKRAPKRALFSFVGGEDDGDKIRPH